MNLNTLINANKRKFNIKFKKLLKNKLDKSSLSNAMFYGSMNGGKRIRPFLVMESAKIAKISSFIDEVLKKNHAVRVINISQSHTPYITLQICNG